MYIIHSVFDPARQHATGETIPLSGVYRVLHERGDTTDVTLVRGNIFPSCNRCGDAVRFTLLAEAPADQGPRSGIVVYEVPHPVPGVSTAIASTPDDTRRPGNILSRNSHLTQPVSRARVIHGPYYADIVHDRLDSRIWLYVVQREGSVDILAMGSCDSEESARETATNVMERLADGAAGTSSAAAS